MVLVLPLLLYPILGFAVLKFALGFSEKGNIIGIVRAPGRLQDFPPRVPAHAGLSLAPDLAWLSAASADNLPGAAAFAMAAHACLDYPLFIRSGRFPVFQPRTPLEEATNLLAQARLRIEWLETLDTDTLKNKQVDLIVTAPADFYTGLERAEDDKTLAPPAVELLLRPDDDHSKQARTRLQPLLDNWKKELSKVRLVRKNLPGSFDDPFQVKEPNSGKTASRAEGIVD